MKLAVITLAMTLTVCSAAGAAPGHSHQGPNGGTMVDVQGGHAEVSNTPTEIVLRLSDEKGAPVTSAGATGKATVLSGGKTSNVDLKPVGDDKLTGSLAKPLAAGDKVVVSAKTGDGRNIQVRHVAR